ncbi:MAG: hypothetical protein CFE45_07355 [Burkholderiales bacterium PBB5]|nr:MAG: hypothetical protein CFE45_07355 [Burkholderiales bacterium PBB5]
MSTPPTAPDSAPDTPQHEPAVPEGFSRHTRRSPLTEPWEPLYARRDGTAVQLGLRLREAHCNSRLTAHGGLVSALADNAMGLSVVQAALATGVEVRGAVTVSLALDFIDSAVPGEWLVVAPRVLRSGRGTAFVECHVHADDRLVARGSATFKVA